MINPLCVLTEGICRFTGLQGKIPHVLLYLVTETVTLEPVGAVTRFNPGEQIVCDDVSSIVCQLGARAFHMDEVVGYGFLVDLHGLWQRLEERLLNPSRLIVYGEVTDDVIFNIVDGVLMEKWHLYRVVEVFNIDPVAQITSISNTGDDITFVGGDVFIQRGGEADGELLTQSSDCLSIAFFRLGKCAVVFSECFCQSLDETVASHVVNNVFKRIHIIRPSCYGFNRGRSCRRVLIELELVPIEPV